MRFKKSSYTPQLNKTKSVNKFVVGFESEEDQKCFLNADEIYELNRTRLCDLDKVQRLVDNE